MLRITNRTGLTIVTSMHASSPCVTIGDRPVEMPAAAWEHTLSCGPGLRSLVGEGDGKIEVAEVGSTSPMTGGFDSPPVAAEVEALHVDPVVVVQADAVEPPKAPTAPVHKGKRR